MLTSNFNLDSLSAELDVKTDHVCGTHTYTQISVRYILYINRIEKHP